jgi:hypothetical protein
MGGSPQNSNATNSTNPSQADGRFSLSSTPQTNQIGGIEQAIRPAEKAVQGLSTGLNRWDKDLTSPLFPLPNAPQMQSKPAQIAAGIYQGAIKPLGEAIQSPVGIASMGVAGLGAIPARLVQAAFVPSLAKGAYESTKEAEKLSKDPNATTQDVSRAVSSAVGQGLGALAGYKGALDSGSGKYLPNKGESGSAGLGGPSSRMKESMKAIDEGLEEKPASPVAQFPTSEKGFYSQLQKVLHEKMPNNASVSQIMAIVDPAKGSGVKPDEIKWSNLEGFLDGKKNATKQEVMDYLKNEGAVKFEERTLSGENEYNKEGEFYRFPEIQRVLHESSNKNSFINNLENDQAAHNKLNRFGYSEFLESDDWARKIADDIFKTSAESQFGDRDLVTPQGKNYREVVLTMPDDVKDQKQWRVLQKNGLGAGIYWDENIANQKAKDIGGSVEQAETIKGKPNYTSPHFKDIPNYVAHMRLNERPDSEGNKGLFIEELQSDRHQKAREQGYQDLAAKEERDRLGKKQIELSDRLIELRNKKADRTVLSPEEQEEFDNKTIEAGDISDRIYQLNLKGGASGVPDAPFRKDWHTQLFKRALRDAIDKGHDWIGWTKGLDQVKRYENNLRQQVDRIDWEKSPDGSTLINAIKRGQSTFAGRVGADGKFTQAHPYAAGKTLSEIIGKDMAEKIANGNSTGSFSGDDLTVGGEGMKGFYDQILPNEIGKYVKKWGGKVEEGKTDISDKNSPYRASLEAKIADPNPEISKKAKESLERLNYEELKPIWKVKITPEMRKSIQQGGQPQVSKDTDIFANLV